MEMEKINSVDVLVLQRHILEIQKLEPIYQRAGNINKNGKKPVLWLYFYTKTHFRNKTNRQ